MRVYIICRYTYHTSSYVFVDTVSVGSRRNHPNNSMACVWLCDGFTSRRMPMHVKTKGVNCIIVMYLKKIMYI